MRPTRRRDVRAGPPPDRGTKGPRLKANRPDYRVAGTISWSDDAGESWHPKSKPLVIQDLNTFPWAVGLPDVMLTADYSDIAVRPGEDPTWPPAELGLVDFPVPFDAWRLALAGDAGNLYLAWQDVRFTGASAIAFSMSSDGGSTWSAPIRVNQPGVEGTQLGRRDVAFLPQIAAGGGRVAITFYDFRNDDNAALHELADIWTVSCSGACTSAGSWSEARVTATSFDLLGAAFSLPYLMDWSGLAFDGQGGFWGAFGQPVSDTDPWGLFLEHLAP